MRFLPYLLVFAGWIGIGLLVGMVFGAMADTAADDGRDTADPWRRLRCERGDMPTSVVNKRMIDYKEYIG